jgi:hypothetical protein
MPAARGIEVSDVEDLDWGRLVHFADPDGNRWALQHLPSWAEQSRQKRGGAAEHVANSPACDSAGGPQPGSTS